MITDSALFGAEKTEPKRVVSDSSLGIDLKGVIAGSSPLAMVASSDGAIDVLQAGSSIRSGITVYSIEPTRIVIDNQGNLESIPLPDTEKVSLNTSTQSSSVPSVESIVEEPEKLLDIVNISTARRDGDVVGYRVEARAGHAELLERAGVEDGDVITHVSGSPISDTGNLSRLMEKIPSEDRISVRVVRDGKPTTTEIDTGAFK